MRFTAKMTAIAALVGSLGLGGAVALAQGDDSGAREGMRAKMLEKYDTNHDGKLDDTERAAMRADFQAKRSERRQEMLARFDTNKDGKLDENERKVMKDTLAADRFKKLDTNGDGVLSLQEFQAGAERFHRHFGRGAK
jgi:Ca2+-binding EF-hand superfamily protein